MTKKQKGKGTTPKGAVELKEDALDQASGGTYKSNLAETSEIMAKVNPGASKIAQKVWGDPH